MKTPDFDRDALLRAAQEARQSAYAPYSNYTVGAALLTADGEIISGCNVENAVYPASICAERVTITKAISEGHREFVAIAVATRNGGSPCGICRQVMYEFAPSLVVLLVNDEGKVTEQPLSALLPNAFGPQDLAE